MNLAAPAAPPHDAPPSCPSCSAEVDAFAWRCPRCGAWFDVDPVASLRRPPAPAAVAPSTAGGALWLDDEPARDAPRPAPPAPAAAPQPETGDRQARRAAVRQARLRAMAEVRGDTPSVPEVLVFDRHGVERGMVCGLLQGLGFATHGVGDAAQALALAQQRRFAAIFADFPLDGGDGGSGIAFARGVHALVPRPLFVLASAPLTPVGRVRADLAGFDAVLAKPLARGAVAGVFDSHGIALPADARRGA